MMSRFNILIVALAVALTAVLLDVGVAGAHGGEEHTTSAADGFSRFGALALAVTVIVVGSVLWLSYRDRQEEPHVLDSAGRAGRGTPHQRPRHRMRLDQAPVGATTTDRTAGPAPEPR